MSDYSNERWAPVKDYEGLYEVSDYGRVRRLEYVSSNGCKQKAKMMMLANDGRGAGKGYYAVSMTSNHIRKQHKVHRLVARAFLPVPSPERIHINHMDCCTLNNYYENLEWVTPLENAIHAGKTGLLDSIRGDRHYSNKLSTKQVLKIRELCPVTGDKKLAKQFNVSYHMIYKIRTRRSWSWLS